MKTVNTVPSSFPGIAHIYITKEGAGGGGYAGLEAIPFSLPRNCDILSLKFRAQEAFPRGEKPLMSVPIFGFN